MRASYRSKPIRRSKTTNHYAIPAKRGSFRLAFLTLCSALVVESVGLQLWSNWSKPATVLATESSRPVSTSAAIEGAVIAQAVDPTPPPAPVRSGFGVSTVLAATPNVPLTTPTIIFHSPLRSYWISQYFSAYHPAIDMADPTGTPVYATTVGVVSGTGFLLQGGGLMVEVQHPNGYISYYAHLSAITSQVGQSVDNTVQIGRVGQTGVATGPHLHFMVTLNGRAVNPLPLIQ